MDDRVIVIRRKESNWFKDSPWQMTIDLQEIAKSAGERVDDPDAGGKILDYPMSRAKKLLKLIVEHGDPDEFWKCEKWFKSNKKLYEWWKRYTKRSAMSEE